MAGRRPPASRGSRGQPPPPGEGILARALALLAHWENGRTLQELLPGPGHEVLQNGLLTLFRHLGAIDWVLGQLCERPPRPRLARLLRWAACEILFVRSLPPALMVNLATLHARRAWGAAEAGFVNAVLRRLTAAPPDECLAERLATAPPAVRLGLGNELCAAWQRRFQAEDLVALAALLQTPAPLIVRLRPGFAPPPATLGLAPLPAPDWAPAARLFRATAPPSLFAAGPLAPRGLYVQDPSTLLAPALLAVRPGEVVADLCAAPGGKALLLAEALAGQGRLICADRSPARLRRLQENLTPFPETQIIAADAAHPPLPPASLDAVLLDVPCTNTGVLRRRPDARWRFSAQARDELVLAQRAILQGAARLLRPGGRLVYSTCSIEPEENSGQLAAFLAAGPEFVLETERLLLPGADHDGAYAARLRRRA